MTKIITITNQKGGVGKTTTTSSLTVVLKRRGFKVLVIDMDPQGNLSFCLGADSIMNATIYDVLRGEIRPQFAIQHTKTVDVIPSNILLSGIELEFTSAGREYLLKNAINSIKGFYDYILIDTPPALSVLTVNALAASTHVIIPMVCDIFSVQGITQLVESIGKVKELCNEDLKIGGVLVNKFNKRILLNKEVKGAAELVFQDLEIPMFKTTIRNSIGVTEAQAAQQDIVTYDPKNGILRDYISLISEMREKGM